MRRAHSFLNINVTPSERNDKGHDDDYPYRCAYKEYWITEDFI